MTLLHNIARTLQRRRNITWHALGYDTKVRGETPADHAAIAQITATAFNNTAEVQLITQLRQHSSECLSLVAEQHAKLVGHIMFSPATLDNATDIKLMALAPMAVSNVLQHQGIGSALLRSALELADQWLNIRRLELTVYSSNEVAVALYERFGFEVEAELSDFAFQYGKYVSALCMARINSASN